MASIKEVILPSGNAYEFRDAITHVELTQAEYDALVAAGTVDNDKVYFITDGDAPASSASDVTYSNISSGLEATNVQDAIDELVTSDTRTLAGLTDTNIQTPVAGQFFTFDGTDWINQSVTIPTKTSDLTNDSGFITQNDIPAIPSKTSDLQNDSGFITSADVPTKTSELENDSNFVESSDLADVATSGSYNDLIDKPTIPASQVNSDWNANTGVAQILNKPTIPTKTSDLDNDSGFAVIDDTSTANDKAWSSGKITSELSGKANSSDLNNYYNKTETDNKLANKADKSDTYTKAQTDSAIVGLIDDTTTANNKAWSSSKISDEIIAILPTGTASGSVASFNTSLALPLVSCKANITATQEAGTPTPSTPKSISGWSAVEITANADTETIALGGTYYGGILDVKNGVLTITHVIKSFNDFTWSSSTWGSYTAYSVTESEAKSNPSSTLSGLLCEIYSEVTPGTMYSSASQAICLNGKIVRIRDTTYSTFNEWKEAVKNYKIVYELANPIVISDLASYDFVTLIGANSFSADSGNVEVTYKKSIDDAIAELQALILS